MGFFDAWKVTGITTDASKFSCVFHTLAEAIEGNETDIPIEHLLEGANLMTQLSRCFHLYFNQGIKSEKVEAIKFLVAFSSYGLGKDGLSWNWQEVRHLSQGLYGSMEESPAHFLHYNTPLIEIVNAEINIFITENS